MSDEPTVAELLEVPAAAVRGQLEKDSDWVRGSDYEALLGPSAILWSRQARRDTDLFNSGNFNTAVGEDLTRLVYQRFKKPRILDTRGRGTAILRRSNTGSNETVWAGTRVFIFGDRPKTYRVVSDTPAPAGVEVIPAPIEAEEYGPRSMTAIGVGSARVEDLLALAGWTVDSLVCRAGTTFESAPSFRTRVRTELLDDRVGMEASIIAACEAAGASQVALFRCDYAGDAYDYGLNYCYVGSTGYVGTPELVKACSLALRGVRVAGDNLQVLPMGRVNLDVSADVYLVRSPSQVDLARLERILDGAVRQYMNAESGRFGYSLAGLRAAITHSPSDVQRVVIATPSIDGNVVVGDMKNLPAVLNRYVPGNLTFNFLKV